MVIYNSKHKTGEQGFTLIELLISMAVMILIAGMLITFQRDLFSVNNFLTQTFSNELAGEEVVRQIVAELRTAAPSSIGAYTIERADPNNIAFYANIDKDVTQERVQYFLDGKTLRKSVIDPGGSILTYATTSGASEVLKPLLRNVVLSTTTPLFSYFSATYGGTSTPLVQPVNIVSIRHIGIRIELDDNTAVPPPSVIVSSNVSVRNLKDNL